MPDAQETAQQATEGVTQAMGMAGEQTQEIVGTLIELVSQWGLQVVGAVALFIVGRIAAGWVRSGVRRSLEKAGTDAALVPFFTSTAYYVLLAAVVIAVLGLFGIETTSLVAVLASAGLAIGLAMQGTLSNFAAGVMLLIFRPFRLGDYVEVAGSAGSVQEIGLFTTVMNTVDNVRIIVPNSAIFGDTIKNYAGNETRRVDLVIGIGYGDDIGVAVSTIQRVVKGDSRVLGAPEPQIAVAELGDSSVNLVVRPWCRGADYWDVRFDLTRAIKEQLEAAGCSIPFPQRDVHVHQTAGGQAT